MFEINDDDFVGFVVLERGLDGLEQTLVNLEVRLLRTARVSLKIS